MEIERWSKHMKESIIPSISKWCRDLKELPREQQEHILKEMQPWLSGKDTKKEGK
jgi:hypothetical protein